MILFPAIDIKDSRCVRLTQGNYNNEIVYSNNPVHMASQWETQGAEYLHLVDLNGAKTGQSKNIDIVKKIADTISIPVQIGGGIRSLATMENYLNAGMKKVILGTAAIEDKSFLAAAISKYPTQTIVSIDARNGLVATNGWTEISKVKARDLAKELEQLGLQTLIYTDILKDGMLSGPNFTELQIMQASTSMNIIASGGVTTMKDVTTLSKMKLHGAIIGKSLYDGSLTLKQGLEAITNVS